MPAKRISEYSGVCGALVMTGRRSSENNRVPSMTPVETALFQVPEPVGAMSHDDCYKVAAENLPGAGLRGYVSCAPPGRVCAYQPPELPPPGYLANPRRRFCAFQSAANLISYTSAL
jgi:hypothetical protein